MKDHHCLINVSVLYLGLYCSNFASAGQIEQCQTLVTATQLHPECEAFGDCSGLTCQLQYIAGSASFVVTKCQDPVSVDFRINASSIDYQQQFDQSGSVSYNGVVIVVQMSRNDTFLDFMVSFFYIYTHTDACCPYAVCFFSHIL